jgi:hypothetical protein
MDVAVGTVVGDFGLPFLQPLAILIERSGVQSDFGIGAGLHIDQL